MMPGDVVIQESRLAAPHSAKPVGALMVAMISIQIGASVAKGLFPIVGPEGTTALRLGLAALMLTVVLRPWRARLTVKNGRWVLAYGIALGTMNLLFYMALARIPLGIAVALEFTGPLGVAMMSSRRAIDFMWIALAGIGILLLLPVGIAAQPLDRGGIAFALGAGICWALYIICGQRAGAEHGARTVALGTIIAAIAVLPIGIAHAGAALFAPMVLGVGLAVAVLSSALPYTLDMVALRRLPARMFGILTSIEPALAALMGFVFLRETLLPAQWAAIGLIIAASIGTTMTGKADKSVAAPG